MLAISLPVLVGLLPSYSCFLECPKRNVATMKIPAVSLKYILGKKQPPSFISSVIIDFNVSLVQISRKDSPKIKGMISILVPRI